MPITLQGVIPPDMGELDMIAIYLGYGCILLWLSLLQYIKFHRKFSVSVCVCFFFL